MSVQSHEISIQAPEAIAFARRAVDTRDTPWSALTTLESKSAYFGVDAHFRSCLHQFRAICGDTYLSVIQGTAMLVVQPDGVAARTVEAALSQLRDAGFQPAATTTFRYTRQSVREEWNYQFNEMTLERMDLTDAKYRLSPSLLILFRSVAARLDLPEAVRLQLLKGPSSPQRRRAGCLRDRIGSPNGLLKYIHSPDEPADVIRELGSLLSPPERDRLLLDLAAPAHPDQVHARALRLAQGLYATTDALNLDPVAAAASVQARLQRHLPDGRARRACEILDGMKVGTAGAEWLPFRQLMFELKEPLDWDCIVLGATSVTAKYEGDFALVRDDGAEGWLGGKGTLIAQSPGHDLNTP